MRVKLVVAYDGTNYCGWQVQPNGNTIEAELNAALSELLGEDITVLGASRTDAGVHSLGNVAIFDTSSRMPAEKIAFALNTRLPRDIVVQNSTQVDDDWHPHKVESKKTYEYRILNRTMPLPQLRDTALHHHYELDVEAMRVAAKMLEGEHDFTSFSAVNAQVKSRVRTIYSCDVLVEPLDENAWDLSSGQLITIRVTGNGFLYNMVRIIAGTLLQVGSGKVQAEEIREILDKKDRDAAGPTAPAHGLTMMGIKYL